jgi:hypothetical protein
VRHDIFDLPTTRLTTTSGNRKMKRATKTVLAACRMKNRFDHFNSQEISAKIGETKTLENKSSYLF